MYRSELLRIASSRAALVVLLLVLAEALLGGLGAAFLPRLIDGLIKLNEVIPNATEAGQLPSGALESLSLEHLAVQATVADLSGGFGLGVSVATLGAMALGALSVTNEYRRGSIILSTLAQSSPVRLLFAKASSLSLTIILVCVPLIVIKFAILYFGAFLQGVAVVIDPLALSGIWVRGAVVLVCFGLMGFGLGLLVRSSIGSLAIIFGFVIIESSLRPISALVANGPTVVNLLPFGLPADAVRGAQFLDDMSLQVSIGTVSALLALSVWTITMLLAGSWRFAKSESPVFS